MDNVVRKIKERNTLERVKKHGLHFYSPVDDPLAGICLGDGKMGCLIWPDKDKLSIAVNHTDLWDLADTTEVKNWDLSEEEIQIRLIMQAGWKFSFRRRYLRIYTKRIMRQVFL